MQKKLCERNFHKASFCRDVLFTIAGANPDNFDLVLLDLSFFASSLMFLFLVAFWLLKLVKTLPVKFPLFAKSANSFVSGNFRR